MYPPRQIEVILFSLIILGFNVSTANECTDLLSARSKIASINLPDYRLAPYYLSDQPFANPQSLNPPLQLSEFKTNNLYLGAPLGRNGTGVHLGDGVVVTAAHVLRDILISSKFAEEETSLNNVRFPKNYEIYDGATILRLPKFTDADINFLRTNSVTKDDAFKLNDWVVLQLPKLVCLETVPIVKAASSELVDGEAVWVMGFPLGGNDSMYLSAGVLRKSQQGLFISNIQLRGGFSGGPVLNSRGELIGLISTYFSDTGHANFVSIGKIRSGH